MMERENNLSLGVLILAGGKGRRMGYINKALLEINGETFLERLAGQVSEFTEKLLSVGTYKMKEFQEFQLVQDVVKNIGPMGGIYSGLLASKSEKLLVLSCDIPFFQKNMIKLLEREMQEEVDVCIFKEKDGRIHPLCGIYSKRCLPVLEKCIKEESYKMIDFLKKVQTVYVEIPDVHTLVNINTREEWEKIL